MRGKRVVDELSDQNESGVTICCRLCRIDVWHMVAGVALLDEKRSASNFVEALLFVSSSCRFNFNVSKCSTASLVLLARVERDRDLGRRRLHWTLEGKIRSERQVRSERHAVRTESAVVAE
jgi:hypothetical protein